MSPSGLYGVWPWRPGADKKPAPPEGENVACPQPAPVAAPRARYDVQALCQSAAMNDDEGQRVQVLDVSRSWALLREAAVGRLAVVVDDEPDIFPVNYVVDHGSIVFRTAEGTKLAAALGKVVAFETDGYSADTGEAWSVVARGQAKEIRQLHDVLESLELPLSPWHGGAKGHLVRITPDRLTGLRFTTAGPHSRNPESPRRAPLE